jgi:hypothetical protein
MVDNNSILARYDADLEGGGDHLIGERRNPVLTKQKSLNSGSPLRNARNDKLIQRLLKQETLRPSHLRGEYL